MARKIDLRTVRIGLANGAADGSDRGIFNYADMIKAVLTFGPPNKGLVLDEVIKAVDAVKPLDQAVAKGEDHVVFSEEQWRTLRDKLDQFPFAIADTAIAEFGLAIRNAKEITG